MRRLHALVALLLVAGCAGAPRREPPPAPAEQGGGLYAPHIRDGGPAVPPDLSGVEEPEPRREPRARYGNRSPYTVLGRSYRVIEDPRGHVERGVASWYGEKFHGRATSSMEPYDMYAMTAAHKTLPLPTYARVTNLENGRSVVLRINDRGPFKDDRILDLSYAAAVRLDVHRKGTARVEVRVLDEGVPLPAGAAVATAPASAPARIEGPALVQVGSFADKENARALAGRLREARLRDVHLDSARVDGRRVWRVRLGPFRSADEAQPWLQRVMALGHAAARIIPSP